ncbi:uncharacterized protein LOC128202815 isoform X2 [Mya arenaria]|uniref:uncharacterized protein LOC128202815 isoform X2 n=1 Tax=Mya arenaria TaxID=6604 RepID=UPI0022E473DF|nr:uncharacterized protein LOC128202815 isoform X2 [Mya arenaria]
MIKEQLLFKIYHDKDIKEAYDLLQTVLETKRCVIIADGLDEWSHPSDKDCSCSDEEKVVPFRNFANNAILLTTSRPWRLSQFRIKDSNIDKYLEIQGAVDPSSLVEKVVNCLNGETGTKTSVQFMEFVREKGVEKLLPIPIILMQLVCLWYEEFNVSNSICNIYASMISMLFGKIRVDNRQTKVLKHTFPGCIQCQCNIRTHGSLFRFLSHLALKTLFTQNMQSSNVFSISCVTAVLEENSGDELLERALESGLLTEERLDVANTSNFSFLHKTFQEFLAAVYVCMNEDLFSKTIKTHYMERHPEFIMDVSQVFIFICGLNMNLGEDMSKWISTFIPQKSMKACLYDNYEYERARPNENIVRAIQGMVIEGYKEAISNNYVNTQITLNHFYFDDILLSAERMELLYKLLLMNKHRVKSIHVSECNDQLGQKNLQDVLISSKDSLTALTCWDHSGEYDLKMCKCFKYLSIWGDNLFKIELNVKNLLTCKVLKSRKSVEESLLNKLSKNGKQLQTFIAYELKNVELFSNIFPQFRQLRYVCITNTDFKQFPFIPPDLISRITMKWVIMSASALRDMLDRIATLPRNVHVVFEHCSIQPSSELRRIRQLLDVSSNISIEHFERSATDVSFEVKSNG